MATAGPRYSMEEFARRGDAIYERDIKPIVKKKDWNKFVAIDIETGDFEIDADELAAADRLRERVPDPQIWLLRVGTRYVWKIRSPRSLRLPRRRARQ